jgi:hypothetical protein
MKVHGNETVCNRYIHLPRFHNKNTTAPNESFPNSSYYAFKLITTHLNLQFSSFGVFVAFLAISVYFLQNVMSETI